MAVYKRNNGNWFVQFAFQGKTYIKSANSKKKSDAVELERKMREDLHKHVVLGLPKEITCEAAINLYLDQRQDSTSFSSIRGVANWYLPRLKGLYLHQLTTVKFHELINEKKNEGAAANTLLCYKQLIVGTNKLARKMGYMPAQFEAPDVKRSKGKLRYLTIEEESRLLDSMNPRYADKSVKGHERFVQDNYDFVVLLLDTGARLSEIANLTWDDVDIHEGTIKLWRSKVQNESILKLADRSWSIIRRRYNTQNGKFVFSNIDGTKAKQTMTSIRRAFDRAGLPDVTIHTLRHTHASRLIQNGASLYEVQHILGHANLNTTTIYAHLDNDQITTKAKDIMDRTAKKVQRLTLKVVNQ